MYQGCHIFLGTTCQNWKNIPKDLKNVPNGHINISFHHKIDKMAL
jgi:hypothetical protein